MRILVIDDYLNVEMALRGILDEHTVAGVRDPAALPRMLAYEEPFDQAIVDLRYVQSAATGLTAVTAGLGTWLTGSHTPHGLTGQAAGVVTVVVALLFGLAQWRDELRRGYYTRAQAAAPTKIWHQVVVYPVLGYWLWTAGIGGLSVAGGAAVWAGKALLLALTGIWVATNVYDRRHPKLGHPPFDWRRARPWPRPWAVESQTLLAAAKGGLPGSAKFCMGWRPYG